MKKFMKYIIITIIIFNFTGCYMATKTKELGGGISNLNHPIALAIGAGMYYAGKSLE